MCYLQGQRVSKMNSSVWNIARNNEPTVVTQNGIGAIFDILQHGNLFGGVEVEIYELVLKSTHHRSTGSTVDQEAMHVNP